MMHTKRLLQWTAGLLLAAAPALAFAQTGPGGVGDASSLKLWLRADAGVYTDAGITPATDNQPVQEWHDQSGNGLVFSQPSGSEQPTYKANFVNAEPVLQFDGVENWIGGTINNGSLSDNFTIFIVARFGHLNQPNGDYDYLLCVGGGYVGANRNLSLSRSAGNFPSGGDRYFTFDGAKYKIDQNIPGQTWTVFSERYWTIAPRHRNWFNGSLKSVPGPQSPLQTNGLFEIGRYTSGNSHHFKGEVAEVIVYNYELNKAERIIIQNYLASKYGIAVTDDKYAHDDTHRHDVFGIGNMGTNNTQSETAGPDIVGIYNPSTLLGLDYLLLGHDDKPLGFATTDVPPEMSSTGLRLERSWRASSINNPGTVTLKFNLTGIPIANPDEVELLIDADGVFASGATRHTTGRSWDATNAVLTFTDVDLTDGDRLSLAWGSMSYTLNLTSTKGNQPGAIEVVIDGGLSPLVLLDDAANLSEADFNTMNSYRTSNWPSEGVTPSAPSLTYEEYLSNVSRPLLDNLSAGRYAVKVIDRTDPANWVTYAEERTLGHEVSFNTITGASYSATDQTVTKTAATGWNNMTTEFRNQADPNGSGWIEAEIITANTKHAFGFLNDAASNTYLTSMKHGLLLDAGAVSIIDGGNTTATGTTYGVGDRFRVAFENGTLTYYKNKETVGSSVAISGITKFIPSVETYEQNAELRFVSSLGFLEMGQTVTTLSCSAADNGSIYLDAPQDVNFLWSNGSNSPAQDNLTPGIYSVTAILPNGTATTHSYLVGNEVNWSPVNYFTFPNPATNTIQHNNATGNIPGGGTFLQTADARSMNQFPGNFTNPNEWASFEVVTQAMTSSDVPPTGWPTAATNFPYGVYFGLEDTQAGTSDYGIYLWGAGGNTSNVLWLNNNGSWTVIGTAFHGDRLKLQITDNSGSKNLEVYRNEVLVTSVPFLGTAPIYELKAEAYHENNAVKEALCSFLCDLKPSFNRLSEQLDGQQFYTLDSKLFFYYEGEYNTGTLNYKVVSEMGADVTNVVPLTSPDGTATASKSFGDNRYVLDFHQLADGYYTLEVTNEKNETYSLRIYKYL